MKKQTKAAKPQYDQKWHDCEIVVKNLQHVIQMQKDPRLQKVKVWLKDVNSERGMIYMGVALGQSLGCSPFCGCATKQIGDQFEPYLLERLPWLQRVIVQAEAPADDNSNNVLLRFV